MGSFGPDRMVRNPRVGQLILGSICRVLAQLAAAWIAANPLLIRF
jgi:hypothetical protein